MKQRIKLVETIQQGMSHVTIWMDVNVNQSITVLCYLRIAKEYIIRKR